MVYIIRSNIDCTEKNGEGEGIIDCLDMMRRVRGYIIAYLPFIMLLEGGHHYLLRLYLL